ncbi:MAG: KH domain-containing protein [Firmicutes bacterium]|nr:KH domain-containing protein [Bacillota bacterium]MDY5336207.1 RNA-binding cell elongation regulator Jag/EloR [Bacilli bacterium]
MNKYYYEGKTKEQAMEMAIEDLKVSEEDLIINKVEDKSSLLKKLVRIEVLNMNEVVSFIKDTINEIISKMNTEANLEVRRRDNSISITIFSDNNAILIGKNGKNVSALQLLIRQMVNSNLKEPLSIIIDVGNYKEKRARNIEYLAKKLAREAYKTKTEITMDSMNSYERRLVHSALADDKYVYTESIGEEPNRKVVIKLKGE